MNIRRILFSKKNLRRLNRYFGHNCWYKIYGRMCNHPITQFLSCKQICRCLDNILSTSSSKQTMTADIFVCVVQAGRFYRNKMEYSVQKNGQASEHQKALFRLNKKFYLSGCMKSVLKKSGPTSQGCQSSIEKVELFM